MPQLALIRGAIAVIGALVVFSSSLFNIQPQQFSVLDHRETKNQIIFNCQTKTKKDTVVEINKNTGKVKISFHNKRDNIEFNIEYSGEIAPEDRTNVDTIMNSINEYTKKNKSISNRIRSSIKDFVNKKL